ncbi:hypothetical protein MKX01_011966, partial [Papaver californicum]
MEMRVGETSNNAPHDHHYNHNNFDTTTTEEELEIEEEDDEDEYEDAEEEEEDEPKNLHGRNKRRYGKNNTSSIAGTLLGRVLDPRAKWVQEWNRVFLLVCATRLFVDPLFFYALSISETCMCLFIGGWFAITVTVFRNLGFRERSAALRYLKAKNGFFFDLFVILPVPQVVLWVVIPSLLDKGSTTMVMTIFLIMFLFQYLPKIHHSVCFLRRTQLFWLHFRNCLAAGACWYLLGLQRASKCLKEQCRLTDGCGLRTLSCEEAVYYGTSGMVLKDKVRLGWGENRHVRFMCLNTADNFSYGAYKWTVPLVTNNSRLEKILFPIFWGLMTLSTFGNLESTTEWLEVVFNIIILTSGLVLVTMLIGNIKVFLHATTSKKQTMQLKMRNIEWWMRRRKLPPGFKHRVRQYERQRWAAMRGVDECEMIANLPEGLRRDIKYHLCLDLVRQVPLFQHMDDLVLENICDRVKSLIFPKGETITQEGDPVQRMLFVVRGHLQSSQVLRDGVKSCCMLGPGNFSGDELLSWCLRRPFIDRLPPSSSSLVTLETTEAFGLEAEDVKYVSVFGIHGEVLSRDRYFPHA